MDDMPSPTHAAAPGDLDAGRAVHWRRNMYVCLFGSFTTLLGMTLLLPFLPLYVAELGVKTPAAWCSGRASPTASPSWGPGSWRRSGAGWPICMAASSC